MVLKDRLIAYIDLTKQTVETKRIPLSIRRKYLGGRGLDAYLLYNHTRKGVDPLGPGNAFLVSAGILVGTLASASARTHVCAKSPLTGAFGSSNTGGFFGPELRFAGFDHLVIKGKARKPTYLWINNNEIEFRDAEHLWGQDNYTVPSMIREEHNDPEIQVLLTGIAGENLVRYANVMTGRKNAAGRTGMGAVMGSKNLKAIAVRGTRDLPIAQPKEALEYNRKLIEDICSTKFAQIMGRWGTMFIFGVTNTTGLVRTRNFQDNQLQDSEDLECENIDRYSFGTDGCFGCQIHCRHRYRMQKGDFEGIYAQGPEYTSQGAFGMEVGCRSMDTVLAGNHLVNLYGIDSLETGSMMGWAMELYEKGIITTKDTNGLELDWGNDEAVLELIKRIALRQDIGDILAEGPIRAAKKIGKESLKYNIQVKGMSNLHSDERPTPSLALGIATGTRGSDHLRSRPAFDLYHLPEKVLRHIYSNPVAYDGPLTSDYRDYEGKPWQVLWHEMCYMAVDCLGVCKFHVKFLSPNLMGFDEFAETLRLNTGIDMSTREIWEVAERCYTLERLFNIREGFTRKDDWLVDRYFDEPTTMGLPIVKGKKLDRRKFKKMINDYYKHHDWDKEGVPRPEKLEALGIAEEPSHEL